MANDGIPYTGSERRQRSGYVTQEQFDRRMGAQDNLMERQNAVLTRLETALFAPDANNPNEQPGLMVTARNIDNHITVVCNIGKWIARGVTGTAALVGSGAAIGKALGWW